MKNRDHESESLLHCKNCDGYYDPSLPNCPHCGEDTANNLNNAASESSVTQYGGGFGEAGSTLSRVALLIISVLLIVALLTVVVMGVKLLSSGLPAAPAVPASSSEPADPADTSADAKAAPDASASAPAKEEEPKKEETKKKEQPAAVPPKAIHLDFNDLTLVNDGESHQFKVTVEPADWEGDLTWTTDNKSVAVVTSDGKVTSVGKGECNVTVSAGDISYRCIIRCKSGAAAGDGGSDSVTSHYANGTLGEAKAEQNDSNAKKKEEE